MQAASPSSGSPRAGRDTGFTLIELLVTMAVLGILVAVTGLGFNAYASAQAEKGTANDILTLLRSTAQQAQSEGRTYCVSFDSSTSWTLWRYSCDPSWSSGSMTATQLGGSYTAQGSSYVDAISLTAPSGLVGLSSACPHSCAYFYPRGIASSGSLAVHRSGTTKTYVIHLEGLTSRAYIG